jgi:hypothetical protein
MPEEDCSVKGVNGKRWGEDGKCYVGVGAGAKAKAQGRAIEASKHAHADEQYPTGFHEDAELLAQIKANGMTLHTNDVKITGKPIYKDSLVTVVPILLTEEGVHNNALKDWDTLYDPNGLEGFMWFERRPIVDGHPGHAVNHLTQKYGYIQNVEPDPLTRTVPAEAVLFNNKFSDEDLLQIDSGTWKGISIGYYCNELKTDGLQTWKDGSPYDHKEIGPLYADHVALTNRPACKRCGLNTNSLTNFLCSNCNDKEINKMSDVTPASAGKEGAPAGGAESAEKIALNELGKKAVAAVDKKLKANQIPEEIAIKARTILSLGDDYAKGKAALDLLMEIALAEEEKKEGSPAGAGMEGNALKGDCQHQPQKPISKENDSVMKELTPLVNSITELTTVVKALKADNDTTKVELKQLKEKELTKENEIKANEEKKLSDSIKKNFDPDYQMDWDAKHWPAIKANSLGITAFLADPENLKHWDPKANEAVVQDPVGMNFAMHSDSSVPKGLKMMSIEEMTRKQYPGAAQNKEAGKA